MSRILVLIPARFQSSRFPGKPLALIHGQSMICHVFKNITSSGLEAYVVTDNDEIEKHVKDFGGKVLRVDDDVPSGSERIALAYERFFKNHAFDLVVNVQGDEPLLKGKIVKELADFHLNSTFDIATVVRERSVSENDWQNPNVVKAILSEKGQCLYFSRASVPFPREQDKNQTWHQHIGVYSYRPSALLKFVKWPSSRLENIEKLEQLRALENGLTIGALKREVELMGVDTPEDLKKVEGVLR